MSMPTSKPKSKSDIDFSLFGGAESLSEGRVASSCVCPHSKKFNANTNSNSKNQSPCTCTHNLTNRTPRRTFAPAEGEAGERDEYAFTAPPQDPRDFLWLMTEEPHRSRRMAIMKAHPEVTKLMGHEPLTKYIVVLVVSTQIIVSLLLRHTSPFSPLFILTAYAVGGTTNHNLFLAIHEITHNLAFRKVVPNKMLAVCANLPIGIPYAAAFKGYHIEHHKFMGQDGIDTDLPTRLELLLLNNVLGKVFFATFQILFYALRPTFVRAQKLSQWHFLNIAVQLTFDYLLVTLSNSYRPLIYLIMSSFFAGSLHPCAGHFIAEHYLWDGMDQETFSYYGPLNVLAYNVGYHNEHHDFPSIPWTRLPALRALAPEFYDTIPSHPSWPMVIVNFIRDKEVGIFARAKRLAKTKCVGSGRVVGVNGVCEKAGAQEEKEKESGGDESEVSESDKSE